nr:MAG TPA: hypothetical protein [Microviridae sp. ctOX110]
MNYSSYFQHCYTAAPSPSYEVHPEKVINQDEMNALCPLDETTGKRCEPLVRALDPTCSESERQSLLASLQLIKTSSGFESLSDDVKLQLCKLRSLQTPSELKDFASYVNQICDNMDIETPETPETPEPPQTPSDNV